MTDARPLDVYAVGNALVDIQAQVPDAVVGETGFEKGVMTLADDEVQAKVLAALARVEGADVSRCPGGSAANTVMGIADFGGTTAFSGKTGDDELGTFYVKDMAELGVKNTAPAIPGAQSGTSVILITPDAERTMLTNLAASATLGPADVDEETVKQAQYVYVEGYLFTGEDTKAAAHRIIELAKEHGTKVAFTVSDPFLIGLFKEEFLALARGPVDLLFCNEEEAKALTGLDDATAAGAALSEDVETVAVTLGANGSVIFHEGEPVAVDGVECDPVDTTGAGDMYAAGILYGATHGHSWEAAGRLASAASAKVVSQMGARLAEPFTKEEVAALLAG